MPLSKTLKWPKKGFNAIPIKRANKVSPSISTGRTLLSKKAAPATNTTIAKPGRFFLSLST